MSAQRIKLGASSAAACLTCQNTPCTCVCNFCGLNPCACWNNAYNSGFYQSGSTITFASAASSPKYTVFRLPVKDVMPNKVYVSGRLVTVGILGSDVQAAFAGDKIIFSPGELSTATYEKLTVSLDYGDYMYHYVIKYKSWTIEHEEESNIVKAKLVSKVKQEYPKHRV